MEHSPRLSPPLPLAARHSARLRALLALALLLAPACASAPPPAKLEPPSELASARGKYAGLRMAFDRADDYEKFGRYADVGEKPAASWRGVRAPAGYWVYVYPTWYLWDRETRAALPSAPVPASTAGHAPSPPRASAFQESAVPSAGTDTGSCRASPEDGAGCSADPGESASACGRYGGLLRVIFRPQARSQFPDYHLLGWREGGDWQGATDVPGGFWVYVYPNWYVWEKEVAVPAMRAE